MKNLNNTEGIDFVITWVDGSDPAWQQEKRKTLEACGLKSAADDRKERYRDYKNIIHIMMRRKTSWNCNA